MTPENLDAGPAGQLAHFALVSALRVMDSMAFAVDALAWVVSLEASLIFVASMSPSRQLSDDAVMLVTLAPQKLVTNPASKMKLGFLARMMRPPSLPPALGVWMRCHPVSSSVQKQDLDRWLHVDDSTM